MTATILVVVGTPIPGTLTHALAAAYAYAARAEGAEVHVIDLAHDPIPGHPRDLNQLRMPRGEADLALDPDVARYVAQVEAADHVAFFHPQWWGTYPAALKALVDRVFLSGFAYRYRPTGRMWDALLAGRTARIVMTMDSPRAWNRWRYRNAAETSLKNAILAYSGIRTIGITRYATVRHQSDATRQGWITETARLGRRDAISVGSRVRAVAPEAVPA